MTGLGNTVAKLLRQQRSRWPNNFPDGLDHADLPAVRGSGRLEEVEDISANPGNLRMLRYVPREVQEHAPLVVALHGCTQRAAAYADGAGWIELADRYGFYLLMPEQRRANNPNLCFNWFAPSDTTRDAGEVQSIRQMIGRTIADYHIDQTRVFITGLSAGGAMTAAMLATYPEVFAGGAIIAGLPYQSAIDIPGAFHVMAESRTMPAAGWAQLVRSASSHEGPWPKVSIWQGTADQTVNPQNAAEIAKQWATLHGAGQGPDDVEQHSGYTRQVWNDASGEPAVELFAVSGLGHGTPLATGNGENHFGAAAPFLLEAGLSSSHRIVEFWGLDDGRPTRISESAHRPSPTLVTPMIPPVRTAQINGVGPKLQSSERSSSQSKTRPERHDIGAIINRALRSAGLIK